MMDNGRRPTPKELQQIAEAIAFDLWVNPSEVTDNREADEAHQILKEASVTVLEPEATWVHDLNALAVITLPVRDVAILAKLWKNGMVELEDLTTMEEASQG
jgi:hypothetical protein